MPASTRFFARPRPAVRLAALLLGLASAASLAAPFAEIGEDELIDLLNDGYSAKAFRHTAPPDNRNYCPEASSAAGSSSKQLVVVGFSEGSVARVDLAILFDSASDRLQSSDKKLLDKLARALNSAELQDARFAVAGHTDATGADAVNRELSCARALSARRYLIARGVSGERLGAYGFGSSRPLDANAQNAANRRVEIRRE